MDRDVFGNDHISQDLRVGALVQRGGAAAAVAREQRMGGDLDGVVLDGAGTAGLRDHLGLGQRDLPGKDLYALDAHRAEPRLLGRKTAHRVGEDRAVVLFQRPVAFGGLDGDVGRHALRVGQARSREAVALYRDAHVRLGGGLTCCKGLDA